MFIFIWNDGSSSMTQGQEERGVLLRLSQTDSPGHPAPAHLHPQNAKNDEEGTADDHNVANGLERGHQRLYHQLQPLGPADDPGEQREGW